MMVGDRVIMTMGESEGLWDGFCEDVGDNSLTLVGEFVTSAAESGDSVGVLDGDFVGDFVGNAVAGVNVGDLVGAAIGARVGGTIVGETVVSVP